jgi:16S rRNA (guanine527-N7)-methyltransferase
MEDHEPLCSSLSSGFMKLSAPFSRSEHSILSAECRMLNAGLRPSTIVPSMETSRIAELLAPFFAGQSARNLTTTQLDQISTYIDLLQRWNSRINLTAIRTPDEIVTRHFGESLFAARHLFPCGAETLVREPPAPNPNSPIATEPNPPNHAREDRLDARGLLVDIGSGAGFPGLPIKIWSPETRVTLIESNNKKVAFLREVIRALTLTNVDVFPSRAEDFPAASASTITLRAVERFDQILPTAASLMSPFGRLALLIADSQLQTARAHPGLRWQDPESIPLSKSRLLLMAIKVGEHY